MKAATLQRIEGEIAAGDYGQARDRLHGLLSTYPNDLSLRRRLGDIYWQLRFPAMAGRFWYLEVDKTLDILAACRTFERSCGDDPLQILLALKFRGDVEAIRDTFAGRTLLALQGRAKKKCGCTFEFGKSGREKFGYPRADKPGSTRGWIGCLVAALAALGLMIVGLVTVLRWIF